MKRELKERIKCSGVGRDILHQVVERGVYPDVSSALDNLDKVCPFNGGPQHKTVISRLTLLNREIEKVALREIDLMNVEIDRCLFRTAEQTSAWTWLDDFGVVFVLIGPEKRGFILHERVSKCVLFRLVLHQRDTTRFLRFYGDLESEREKDGKFVYTLFHNLARRMHMPVWRARETFEALVRTCDERGWSHTEFPFVHEAPTLDTPHRLLNRFNLLTHAPIRPTA